MPVPPVEFAHVLLTHRSQIERITQALASRHRLSPPDAEDFAAAVHLKFIEDDYAILRAFAGRSQWSTYLFAVIRRTLQDWHRARWGRWRPTATASRLGPLAVELERLTARDGHTMQEAINILASQSGDPDAARTLDALAAQLPAPSRPTFVSDAALVDVPGDTTAEASVDAREVTALAGRVASLMHSSLSRLSAEDQLILRLRFEQGLPMSAIGRAVGVDGKLLYRRVERMLEAVRGDLVSAGVSSEHVAEVLSRQGFDLLSSPDTTGASS
ncbi:MAG: hypothetical protein AMXMBFR57_29580 [Acidimicrobiia bacterium]|jgi:RNA polymerase sigma factor (sigma-70 family)